MLCSKCNSPVTENDRFCPICGNPLEVSTIPAPQPETSAIVSDPLSPPVIFQTQAFVPDPSIYVRPSNYVFTTSIIQRIFGSLTANVDVVREIDERDDLNKETFILFNIVQLLIVVFKVISFFTLSEIVIISLVGTVIRTLLLTFVTSYVFVFLTATAGNILGKHFGKQETDTNFRKMMKVLSYAYISSIVQVFSLFFDAFSSSPLLLLLQVIVLFYSLYIILFSLKQGLNQGWFFTIVLAISVSIINVFLSVLLVDFVNNLFHGTLISPY